jgi:hypothetical protein
MPDILGTAGAVVDDDPITAQASTCLAAPRADVHATSGRIHDSELDRLTLEIPSASVSQSQLGSLCAATGAGKQK